MPPEASAQLRAVVNTLASPVVSAAAIFYAVTALCAALGVWKMRAWAPLAILAWGLGVFTLGGVLVVLGPHMVEAPFVSEILADLVPFTITHDTPLRLGPLKRQLRRDLLCMEYMVAGARYANSLKLLFGTE